MLINTLLVLAAAAVSASPVERRAKTISVPLTRIANVTSAKNIVEKGKARLGKYNSQVSSGSVTNEDVTYVAPVTIGGTTWSLIVDTGCE